MQRLRLDGGAAGKIRGLVGILPDVSQLESACNGGCSIQRVDLASRAVEAETTPYSLDIGKVTATRYDPVSDALIVGYRVPGLYGYPYPDPYPGHRVARLDFAERN